MSEKYLSEAEIQNIAKYLEVKGCKPDPTKVWGRKMLYAAIATAASDKAYAAGREELARECVDWWGGEADCYNVNQLKYFDDWLKQKGVM
jgi:hypothetical protein